MTVPSQDHPREVSIIVPVCGRQGDPDQVYRAYADSLKSHLQEMEFIYVLDGEYSETRVALEKLIREGEPIRIVQFAHWFGEAAALREGFQQARFDWLMTLPAYVQVDGHHIPKMLEAAVNKDMVIVRRRPRIDSVFKRFQSRIFNGLLGLATEKKFNDVGCHVRLLRKSVSEEIEIYGDLHRFIGMMAFRKGFRIAEINLPQSKADRAPLWYPPGIYLRRILDFLTILFLLKFTKKPLRFFGLLGFAMFASGGIFGVVLTVQRLFYSVAMAERPIILIPALLITLGMQMIIAGLIGEIIIFTHARDIKEYTVEEYVN